MAQPIDTGSKHLEPNETRMEFLSQNAVVPPQLLGDMKTEPNRYRHRLTQKLVCRARCDETRSAEDGWIWTGDTRSTHSVEKPSPRNQLSVLTAVVGLRNHLSADGRPEGLKAKMERSQVLQGLRVPFVGRKRLVRFPWSFRPKLVGVLQPNSAKMVEHIINISC